MGRTSFPSRTRQEEEVEDAPWQFPAEEARRHHPPCIRTNRCGSRAMFVEDDDSSSDEDERTTPTAREARIPDRLPCPPAPRKSRPSLVCGGQKQTDKGFFLCPPDLEAVFARRKLPAK